MKNLINYIALCGTLLCAACNNLITEPKGNIVGVLVDLSDSFLLVRDLSVNELKPLFAIENNLLAPSTCILATITHLRYTETQKFSVQGQTELTANILERKMMRDTFYAHIDQHISEIKKRPIGTDGSFVCYALSKMLWGIVSCEGSKKVIVLSDAMEHTNAFSVYDKTQMAMLKTNPEAVRQILDREYPLPDIRDIEIVFVNLPIDKKADENFHAAAEYFRWYYGTCHKASVSVTTSIPKE